MKKYRTHNCNQLNYKDIGKLVKLSGWVSNKRDHGKLLFIDLRDHFGITQIVINYQDDESLYNLLAKISYESVISVEGKVVLREKSNINSKLNTGEIEIKLNKCIIESIADQLPFQVYEETKIDEKISAKYRFLYLRRQKVKNKILLRNHVIRHIREFFYKNDFEEFQTPILTAKSPEGARDFLVPSRIHKNKFYALPQAPQQFKQLLMMSGFDKYFQIAPCFRDEDSRADRSPGEFYQVDIEMSFVTQEEIFDLTEKLLKSVFKKFANKPIANENFPRITYKEAMLKYGSDKPDLRNPLIIEDLTSFFKESNFAIFKGNINKHNYIARCIKVEATNKLTRAVIDQSTKFCIDIGAKGLAYVKWDDQMTAKGPMVKFLSTQELKILQQKLHINPNDTVFFICDTEQNTQKILSNLRDFLGEKLELIDKTKFYFCWIINFPMFEIDPDTGKIAFSHNPFSMPQARTSTLKNINSIEECLKIEAYQYDIVCNGIELSSGALRNHKLDKFYQVFKLAGYSKEEVDEKFYGIVKGLSLGAPPHGGIAPGLERILMLLSESENIREVVAFPMDGTARDRLMQAPCEVTNEELKYLHIKCIKPIADKLKT